MQSDCGGIVSLPYSHSITIRDVRGQLRIFICHECRMRFGFQTGLPPAWDQAKTQKHFRPHPSSPIHGMFGNTSWSVVKAQLDSAFISGHVHIDEFGRTGLIAFTHNVIGTVQSGGDLLSAYSIYLGSLPYHPHGFPTPVVGKQTCYICGSSIT